MAYHDRIRKLFFLWSLMIGVQTLFAQPVFLRIAKVDVAQGTVTIRSNSSSTLNVSDYCLCHNGELTLFGDMEVIEGSVSIPSADSATFALDLAMVGDLMLYIQSVSCTWTGSVHHYLQWGGPGNANESIASDYSLWDEGDYLPISDRYCFHSTNNITGMDDWMEVTAILEFSVNDGSVVRYSGIDHLLTVSLDDIDPQMTLEILDIGGKTIKKTRIAGQNEQMDISDLSTGLYLVYLRDISHRTVVIQRLMIE